MVGNGPYIEYIYIQTRFVNFAAIYIYVFRVGRENRVGK